MADTIIHTALGDGAARQLANATKTAPQMSRITPRWLVHCLQWAPVEAGIYRLNRVKDAAAVAVDWTSGRCHRPSSTMRSILASFSSAL